MGRQSGNDLWSSVSLHILPYKYGVAFKASMIIDIFTIILCFSTGKRI
jgi:hypothetical protein